ncbi:MAG: nitroreductase family protein [Peptococcaceae bacterium]
METMKTIATRQSCRAYTGEQITEKELRTILEAANAAPVGFGKYDEVKLTVVQNKDAIAKINRLVSECFGNVEIVPTYGAPTIILVSAKITEDPQNAVAYCNAACIVENMALAATDLGLGSVYVFSVSAGLAAKADYYKELKIPDGFMPVSAIAIGKSKEPIIERALTVSKIATEYLS